MSYSVLFLVSILGGLGVFFLKGLRNNIKSILSFSGSYLLGICFLHLLPELFEDSEIESIGIFLLIGFFLQIVLDYTSGGIEHGHTHVNKKRLKKFPTLVFISLCIHALLEAFPIQSFPEKDIQNTYLIALMIHKVPISFILASLLLAYELSKTKIILGILIFSLMAPLGAYGGTYFLDNIDLFKSLLAISVGIILHLATTIILESSEKHQIEWKRLIPMLAGVLLALTSLLNH